jgi:hypothetical protein
MYAVILTSVGYNYALAYFKCLKNRHSSKVLFLAQDMDILKTVNAQFTLSS